MALPLKILARKGQGTGRCSVPALTGTALFDEDVCLWA
jgi:hypothetical protein